VINLYPEGPQPQKLEVAAGTAVLWVSHLASTRLVVVTVTFVEGQKVAPATTAVEGYNGFVLEEHDFIGRMQGDGGKVALRFITPGEYTYAIDHGYITGTIRVR
jgi:plastocyanin